MNVPLMGQLTPAHVTASPLVFTISRPCVLKGPYGHEDELSALGLTTALDRDSWMPGISGETGTHDDETHEAIDARIAAL